MKLNLFLSLLIITQSAYADIYKYVEPDGHVTYSSVGCNGCVRLDMQYPEAGTEDVPQLSKAEKKLFEQRLEYRKNFLHNLKAGDLTNLGLVVEVKSNIAQIQTVDGLKWFRKDVLYPTDYLTKYGN